MGVAGALRLLRDASEAYVVNMGIVLFWHVYAAHEATHAVVGRALGGRVHRWSIYPRPYVEVAYPVEKSLLRDAVGGLAPFLLGLVCVPLFSIYVWQPLLASPEWWSGHVAVYLGICYIMYSSPLGRDYMPLREWVRLRV